MLAYRTFTEHGGLTTKGVTQAQEKARSDALAFINEKLDEGDIISLNESALRSSWGYCYVSVTVWYRMLKE